MSKGAFVTGFLLGGLTGAAATLLMTPQSGQDTRVQLQERGLELKAQFGDLTTQAREQADKAKSQAQERGGGIKSQVDSLTTKAREQADKLTAKIQERGRTVISEETIEVTDEQESD